MNAHMTKQKYGWNGKKFMDFCVWGNGTIHDRSGCQYNEVLLDAHVWRRKMPSTIEAFFYPVGGRVDWVEGDSQEAREIYRDFLHAYRHDPEINEETVPLLIFNVSEANATSGTQRKPFHPAPNWTPRVVHHG